MEAAWTQQTPLTQHGIANSTTSSNMSATTTTATTPGMSPSVLAEARVYLWLIYPPTIFLLGTFGNVMTIVIMRRMTSGESAVNVYFTALAGMDWLFLFLSSMQLWVRYLLDVNVIASHSLVCKLYSWVTGAAATTSCWYLVCMTVHRALSVMWPHRVNSLCTRRTVHLSLAAITVVISALYCHYAIGRDRLPVGSSFRCTAATADYAWFFQKVFLYVDLSLYSLLPLVILVLSNGVLVWKLTASVKTVGSEVTQGNADQVQARKKAASSVTVTVIVVSMAFLVSTLPTSLMSILIYSGVVDLFGGTGRGVEVGMLVYDLLLLLGVSNSAVNFYLYCLSGRRFREEFIKVLCCGGRWGSSRGRGGASSMTGEF